MASSVPLSTGASDTNSRTYRGGFSTSICDLFSSRNKSDCCALACCGLLLSDRNTYLVTGTQETPPWWRRLVINLGIPLGMLLVIAQLVGRQTDPELQAQVAIRGWAVFIVVIMVLCLRGASFRYSERQLVMRELYRRQHAVDDMDEAQVQEYLRLNHRDTALSTAVCSCYPKDNGDTLSSSSQPDLCTCLWKTLAALCCGACCNCWCQCFGLCAIAQQDREIRRDNYEEPLDYITFEPFGNYSPKLRELRELQVQSFWEHAKNMSLLSYKLLHTLAWSLVVLAIAAVLRVETNFTLLNLLVVLATFFQAFFILYFVHWHWNRFDLSLDAVVKYFSSGFVLCTGMAIVYEIAVSTLFGFIADIALVITVRAEGIHVPENIEDPSVAKEFMRDFQKEHLLLLCVFMFLNAFVVAALVEEVVKYFGFWMVEHPDFEDSRVVSLESRGAGITVAMVATALGFACCENLLYVFVYTPPSIANEVATLVARSIFPVHPLAAALQSIGVCRRDLEGDRTMQLGRIILPALLLHGSFDFVLMVMALLQSVKESDSDDDSEMKMQDLKDEYPPLISSVVIVLLGLLYYMWRADAQRERLHELDQGRRNGEDRPLLV